MEILGASLSARFPVSGEAGPRTQSHMEENTEPVAERSPAARRPEYRLRATTSAHLLGCKHHLRNTSTADVVGKGAFKTVKTA